MVARRGPARRESENDDGPSTAARIAVALAALALAVTSLPVAAAASTAIACHASDPDAPAGVSAGQATTYRQDITASQAITGRYAFPADPPKALVMIAHGWTGTSTGMVPYVQDVAAAGALGVALDFRGANGATYTGSNKDDYKVFTGAVDTALAVARFLADCGDMPVILWGMSMGGHISAYTIMQNPGIADHLVMDVGVANVIELIAAVPTAAASAALRPSTAFDAPIRGVTVPCTLGPADPPGPNADTGEIQDDPAAAAAYVAELAAAAQDYAADTDALLADANAFLAQAQKVDRPCTDAWRRFVALYSADPSQLVLSSPALNPLAWAGAQEAGLDHVHLVYAAQDMVVTPDQGLQFKAVLEAMGVPATYHLVPFRGSAEADAMPDCAVEVATDAGDLFDQTACPHGAAGLGPATHRESAKTLVLGLLADGLDDPPGLPVRLLTPEDGLAPYAAETEPAVGAATPHPAGCRDSSTAALPYSVEVGGEPADGYIAYPDAALPAPRAIVTVNHGWGEQASSGGILNKVRTAASWGAIAVAMDYRGDRFEYKPFTGAEDTAAAVRDLLAACGDLPVILWGFSMGGHTVSLTAMHNPDLADYLVVDAGPTNIPELIATVAPGFVGGVGAYMVDEHYTIQQGVTGMAAACPPTEDYLAAPGTDNLEYAGACAAGPHVLLRIAEAYQARPPEDLVLTSPALNPEAWMPSSLTYAYLIYGLADTLVPFDHAVQLEATLTAAGIPARTYLSAYYQENYPNGANGVNSVGLPDHEMKGAQIVEKLVRGTQMNDDVDCSVPGHCVNTVLFGLASPERDPVPNFPAAPATGIPEVDGALVDAHAAAFAALGNTWASIDRNYGPFYPEP